MVGSRLEPGTVGKTPNRQLNALAAMFLSRKTPRLVLGGLGSVLSISVPSKYDRFGFYLHYIVYNAPIVTILGREQLCQVYNKFQIRDISHLKFFMSKF